MMISLILIFSPSLLTGDQMSRHLPDCATAQLWCCHCDPRRTDLADGPPPTSLPGWGCWRWGWPGPWWWWRCRTLLALTALTAAPLRCSVAWRLRDGAPPSYRSREIPRSSAVAVTVLYHWLLSTTIIFSHIPDI